MEASGMRLLAIATMGRRTQDDGSAEGGVGDDW